MDDQDRIRIFKGCGIRSGGGFNRPWMRLTAALKASSISAVPLELASSTLLISPLGLIQMCSTAVYLLFLALSFRF